MVILAIVIISALAYFNIDLRTIFERPEVQKIWSIIVFAWVAYIKPVLMYLWMNLGTLPNILDIPTGTTATSTVSF